ncbi:lethal giant larvae like, C-terminal-domain-containing protein [Scleroderma yunnanense]
MFLSKVSLTRAHGSTSPFPDLTTEARGIDDWRPGILRVLQYHHDVAAVAFDPVFSLLAIGTSFGVIRIFGAPGVDVILDLPQRLRTLFLRFSTSTHQLVCIDGRSQLHIWDLDQVGRPMYQKSWSFDCNVSDISLSPSHTHALVALQTGEIKAYDLLALKLSPYTIPSLWKLQHEAMTQAPQSFCLDPIMEIPLEIILHPRNLSWIFVVFAGGVVHYDLMNRSVEATYKRLNTCNSSATHETLSHHGPSATSMAIHPTGHFFAVGYDDGLIGFWAIANDKQPLLFSTIPDLAGHDNLNPCQSFWPGENVQTLNLEPISKLVWCGFPDSSDLGGDTALLVLGGGSPANDPGLAAHLLPAFSPTTEQSNPLHQIIRDAMIQTFTPKKMYFYSTSTVVRDFCVVPRSNPHFSGAWDPVALICVCRTPSGAQNLEAYKFPPGHFFDAGSSLPVSAAFGTNTVDHLAELLEEMKTDVSQEQVRLPSALRGDYDGVIVAHTIPIKSEALINLSQALMVGNVLALHGGAAWMDSTLTQAEFVKRETKRLLVTIHRDTTVRFHDISPQLLLSTRESPMKTDFPHSFDELTINVSMVLADPQIGESTQLGCLRVQSVHLAQESLECLIALESGEVLVYRFQSTREVQHAIKESDKEITLFDPSLAFGCKFSPYLMLHRRASETTSYSLSDIGFLAVGYADGSVKAVDLRGPSILRLPPIDPLPKGRLSRSHDSSIADRIISLTWTVSGVSSDLQLAVRLIVVHASGASSVYKLSRTPDSSSYSIVEAVSAVTLPNLLTNCSYVIDSKTGASMCADRAGFAAALQSRDIAPRSCFWVTASAQGAQCKVDITGEMVGKVQWNNQNIIHASIVERTGSQSLVAFGNEGEVLVHTLPHLEFLHLITLSPKPESPISVDKTGAFVYCDATTDSGAKSTVTLASLFSSLHAYGEPLTALMGHSTTIPLQPQPVPLGQPSFLTTWIHSYVSVTGERLDRIFAGDNRPVPVGTERTSQNSQADDVTNVSTTTDSSEWVSTAPFRRLHSTLAERGEMLGDLERHMDSLARGTQDMVNQARRLAAEQGGRRWFGF